jgi:hypothetical protein
MMMIIIIIIIIIIAKTTMSTATSAIQNYSRTSTLSLKISDMKRLFDDKQMLYMTTYTDTEDMCILHKINTTQLSSSSPKL